VDRKDFEALRDIEGKQIEQDIRFAKRQAHLPALLAEQIRIENGEGVDLILTISYNPEVGSKTFNVHVPGRGPICRLDVDGPAHRPAGRSHKHALQDTRCPDRNLPDEVVDRPDLSGQGVRELFQEFCNMAKIEHTGVFEAPDEDPA
jgi:hypothetical protein